MSSPFDEARGLAAGGHYREVTRLEQARARAIISIYRSGRLELADRLGDLWRLAFGRRRPGRQEVLIWLTTGEVSAVIDSVMERLRYQTRVALEQSYYAGGSMAFNHVAIESAAMIDFFGGPATVGRSFFGTSVVNFDAVFYAAISAADGLDLDLRKAVQSTLLEGGLAGEGITKLKRRLLVVRTIGENRADISIRWSVLSGYNRSRLNAYLDAAKVLPGMKKVWVTANDDRVCPHCTAQHGQVVDVPADFDAGVTFAPKALTPFGGSLRYPPLHPRCRCTLLPWFDRWEGLATVTPADMRAQALDNAQELGFI